TETVTTSALRDLQRDTEQAAKDANEEAVAGQGSKTDPNAELVAKLPSLRRQLSELNQPPQQQQLPGPNGQNGQNQQSANGQQPGQQSGQQGQQGQGQQGQGQQASGGGNGQANATGGNQFGGTNGGAYGIGPGGARGWYDSRRRRDVPAVSPTRGAAAFGIRAIAGFGRTRTTCSRRVISSATHRATC